jgi:hypothetical protein
MKATVNSEHEDGKHTCSELVFGGGESPQLQSHHRESVVLGREVRSQQNRCKYQMA